MVPMTTMVSVWSGLRRRRPLCARLSIDASVKKRLLGLVRSDIGLELDHPTLDLFDSNNKMTPATACQHSSSQIGPYSIRRMSTKTDNARQDGIFITTAVGWIAATRQLVSYD
jgi:hypothetical protein